MIAFKENILRKIEPSLEKSKQKPLHYTVADDVDLKLIPSFLRSRILKERTERAALNAVLVDVNSSSNQSAHQSTSENATEKPENEYKTAGGGDTASEQGQSKILLESSPERQEAEQHLQAPLIPEVISPIPSPPPPALAEETVKSGD